MLVNSDPHPKKSPDYRGLGRETYHNELQIPSNNSVRNLRVRRIRCGSGGRQLYVGSSWTQLRTRTG